MKMLAKKKKKNQSLSFLSEINWRDYIPLPGQRLVGGILDIILVLSPMKLPVMADYTDVTTAVVVSA